MPRLVPSQVVAFINSGVSSTPYDPTTLQSIDSAELSGLIDLVEQIPEELLTMNATAYAPLICGKARVRDELAKWGGASPRLGPYVSRLLRDAIIGIRDALAHCPDESPAPATSELKFIVDADLRTNLRNDIGAVTRALSNGEWKPPPSLQVPQSKRLLLWDLQNRRVAQVPAAVSALVANKTYAKPLSLNPEDWVLHEYTEIAAYLGIIKPDTATETRLARGFRNLIHPGRAQRLGQKCDRGTALSSVAALDHVVRDLT